MIEIERKYLVKSDGWKRLSLLKKIVIEQGYIHKAKGITVRVRVTDNTAFLAIKGPAKNLSREEYEYEIPRTDGIDMLKLCTPPLVRKTRHVLRDEKNQVWEVDIFKGINRGLIMAEIELESEKIIPVLPDWIGLEVSFDRRYTNTYLANHKVPRK